MERRSKRRGSAHLDSAYATLAGPSPCDGCPQARRCRERLLACASFAAYAKLLSWEGLPREPSRWQFRAIFSPKEHSPEVAAAMRAKQRLAKLRAGTRDGRRSQHREAAAA
jgi:hypothetical protein